MRNYILFSCCILALVVKAGDVVSIHEGSIELPSYEISAPEKSPVFDCKWSYQRARRSIYPYALNDNLYAQKSEKKTWKALYLENEWVKLCVLPEIGGRLFYAIDKTNGYDIFYRQDAIKPANVGMNGAWISGGVEWNVFHHHRISTQMPCNYRLVKNGDGSATIWLGETERRHRMEWTIGITLRPGSSCMEIDGRLVNCTEDSNSMLFWANVATHTNPDYQIIFPQNTEFAAYHAKSSICHWPICREPFTNVDAYTNNVDVSWWKNHTVGNSLFAWELPENFIGGYDHGQDAGTMLVGNRHIIRGGKFWSWGPNSGWPTKILTDARGHYVELMVGAYTDSQPDYNWSAPGETKVFKQYWYGVRNLKGIKMGDETYALNMEKAAPDRLFIAANATRHLDGVEVKVKAKGEQRMVFSQTVNLAPDKPWSATIDVPSDVDETAYTMTVGTISYTPVKHDLSKPCPAEVKAPKRPKDIESTEECYYVGLRAEQFHQPYVDANDYYEEVLRRDPLDVRANTRLGVYYRRHWNLEKAEKHLRAALVRQTKDYTRVKDGEAMYNLGLVLAEKGDVESAIDCLYRAVWTYEYNSAANLKLARIYAAKGDFKMALDRVNEAIDYNAHNLDALCLKASLLRSMVGGDLRAPRERENLLADILSFDPLNAYALYEKDGTMLSDDPEYALELALKFKANGFDAKCREILEAADRKGAYPGVKLHLGKIDEFLKMDLTDWRPFRRETKDALERLSNELGRRASCPSQARVWYALGNVYGNVDTAKAMSAWEKCVALLDNQTIPYALRNLGYGHWKWTHDYVKALDFYRRAIAAKPDEAFFLEEFDHVAEEAKLPMSERYAMLKSHHETVERRAGALTSEIVTGVACGDYDRILEILRTQYIPTFEGAANMHDIYVDALLGKAEELEKADDVKGAIKLYEETESYPANQQVFVELTKRGPRDAQIWHRMGLAYEKLGDVAKAKAFFEKSAAVDTLRSDYCYEKGLSLLKLGRDAEARAIGEAMVKRGAVELDDYVDFFDYEGNRYGSTKDAKNAAAKRTRDLGKRLLDDDTETDEERVTVRPERTNEPLINPGMGWVYYHFDDSNWNYGADTAPGDVLDWFPGVSVIYFRLPWRDLEPEEGDFRWDVIDSVAQSWVAAGKQLAFRFTCNESGYEWAVPEWLPKAGCKGEFLMMRKKPEQAGFRLWEPVWDDPVFLEKYENFIKAAARKWNGNPVVAFIDVGSFGMWGEGHTGFTSKISPEKTRELAILHAKLLKRHFADTPIMISDDVAGGWNTAPDDPCMQELRRIGIGFRDDSIMVSPKPHQWFHGNWARKFAAAGLPVMVESAHFFANYGRDSWYEGGLYDSTVEYQASFQGVHWWPKEFLVNNRAEVERINLRLGYRFVLKKVSWPREVKLGTRCDVVATWLNAGVAKPREEVVASWSLLDDKDTVVWTSVDGDFDFRRLKPTLEEGEKAELVTSRVRFGWDWDYNGNYYATGSPEIHHDGSVTQHGPKVPTLVPGEYSICVSVGRMDGTPRIALPLEGQIGKTRRYRLGKIQVRQGTCEDAR